MYKTLMVILCRYLASTPYFLVGHSSGFKLYCFGPNVSPKTFVVLWVIMLLSALTGFAVHLQ